MKKIAAAIVFAALIGACLLLIGCSDDDVAGPPAAGRYTIEQTISDEAQRNTLAFDGLAFLTGDVGSQSFLPPGKVADYSGFQYLRDNDPTNLGHNTDFVTIIAFNVLHLLTPAQIGMFVERANTQTALINEFAWKRFPLLKAFRRLQEGDLPPGCTALSRDSVLRYAAELYGIDGRISYDRARLFGAVVRSLTAAQRAKLDSLKALNGVGKWNRTLPDPIAGLRLPQDVNVAVMTYASEIFAWYAGSVAADVYFCPERHATYFGSFYLKDWPAMGNPNYTIDEQLTASAGQDFLAALPAPLADRVKGIVALQRAALLGTVAQREAIAGELRKFLVSDSADSSRVIALSERYGELDGEISYLYATAFSEVYAALPAAGRDSLTAIAGRLGYTPPQGAFLYAQPVGMPPIGSTDSFFR